MSPAGEGEGPFRWGRGKGPAGIELPEPRDLFETDNEAEKAKQDALRLLGRRAYSRKEMVEKLKGRGHPAGAIEKTLSAIERLGLVDDPAFARAFIRDRMARRPSGPVLLRRDLLRRGIGADVVEEAVAEAFGPAGGDAGRTAFELLCRRKSRYLGLDKPQALRRMFGFLGRRGFPADVAREACERAWASFADEGPYDAS